MLIHTFTDSLGRKFTAYIDSDSDAIRVERAEYSNSAEVPAKELEYAAPEIKSWGQVLIDKYNDMRSDVDYEEDYNE